MNDDLYNHIQKYKNRLAKLKKQTTLKIGSGKKSRTIKLNLKNRDLVLEWLEEKQKDLENHNGYERTAQIRYYNTLYKELVTYMTNVLYWFNNTDFKDITPADIERVYKGLEEGSLKTIKGRKDLSPSTRKDYYGRVFKSGFFKYIGKDKMAKEVIKRKFTESQEVKFFGLDTLRTITDKTATNSHRLAFWLLFDTGIEIKALCQLRKKNFEWIQEQDDSFYMLHVPRSISKKARKQRHIYIHFTETNDLLKTNLQALQNDDMLFNFKPAALYHALKKVVDKYDLTTEPQKKPITIKDFRSSMATYYLKQDWTTDQIKARLGHAPSSTEIDKYVNYLGISQKKQREKAQIQNSKELQKSNQELQEKIRHITQTNQKQQKQINELMENWKELTSMYNHEENLVLYFIDELIAAKPKEAIDNLRKMREQYMKSFKPMDPDTIIKKSPLYDKDYLK